MKLDYGNPVCGCNSRDRGLKNVLIAYFADSDGSVSANIYESDNHLLHDLADLPRDTRFMSAVRLKPDGYSNGSVLMTYVNPTLVDGRLVLS